MSREGSHKPRLREAEEGLRSFPIHNVKQQRFLAARPRESGDPSLDSRWRGNERLKRVTFTSVIPDCRVSGKSGIHNHGRDRKIPNSP